MSCPSCCGSETGNGEQNTVIVTNCCGLPDPGSKGVDFVGVHKSTGDITNGAQLVLYLMGEVGTVDPPSATQRLFIFSYQILVGVAGIVSLFENVDGDSSFPGQFSTLAAGSLAQHGGLVHRMPNRYLRKGNTLHISHSTVGPVDVVVHGVLITDDP